MSKELKKIFYYIFSSIILILFITSFKVISEIDSAPNLKQVYSSEIYNEQYAARYIEFSIQYNKQRAIRSIELEDQYTFSSLKKLSNNSQLNNELTNLLAPIFLVFDFRKNAIIFSKNSNHRWPLASLTKLMTALIALENLPKDKIIKINEKGEEFKVLDLIKATIIYSSNEATLALSNSFSEKEFILLMNKKAEEIGMKNTIFEEPTGLSMFNQSTGEDVIKLVKYILRVQPLIFEIAQLPQITIIEQKSETKIDIYNTHPFVEQLNFMGGKTGLIRISNGNLLSIFENNKNLVLIVVLGAEDRYEETKKIMDIYIQQSKLD